MPTEKVEKVVSAFREVVTNSTPIAATLVNSNSSNLNVVTTWSQVNVERKINMTSEMFQTINLNTREINSLGCVETTGQLMCCYSPGGYRGVVRETPAAGKVPKKQYIEVWKDNIMFKQFDLCAFDLHGDIYTDNQFGCLEWSQCEEQLLYVAEKKLPKTESFLSSKKSDGEEKIIKGNEYLFVEDWGEQMVGKSSPVLAVADLAREEVRLVEVKDAAGLVLSSAEWAPGGASGGVVAVATSTEPRRYGRSACTNRLSWVVHVSPDGQIHKLSGDGLSVLGAHLSPDKSKLVWLEREAGGAHHTCVRLVKYDWTTKQKTTVIDVVEKESKCTGGQTFYGLYNWTFPKCWLSDNKTIVISTAQRTSVKTYSIDTEACTITEIGGGTEEEYSHGVLQVQGNYVVCWQSSILTYFGVVISEVDPNNLDNIKWITLVERKKIPEDYTFNILYLNSPGTSSDPAPCVGRYSAIYFGPKKGEKVPLIVWSHGGPHFGFANAYNMNAHFFAKLGFAMVMVNYRGSYGCGKESIDYLLGRVGDADVSDVHQAGRHVLESVPHLDPDRCLLYGGSHGGFLSLHLAGQFPDKYKCCATMNPVACLPSFDASDIPDWSFVESGIPYSATEQPTGEEKDVMFKMSPMYYVDKVEAPVLLLLGKKDLRVPYHQGLNYYYSLKAHGKAKVKVLLYDDNHQLKQPANETDFLINTGLWFIDHTQHTLD